MKAPAFWWDRTPGIAAALLMPAGHVYGWLTGQRMARAGAVAGVPVVCIGNFTAGGAGKTPVALALARALNAAGETPVLLTRGYGGTLAGPVVVDPAIHDSAAVGDEPLLLARVAPTVVARDRVAGARLARERGASVIVMDDGLQNPALAKDFTLAVVDGGVGFGNGLCVPTGPLRAPVAVQASHVDAVIAIGMGKGITDAVSAAGVAGKPVFRTNLAVDDATADQIGGTRVLAFAGIGRPEKFFETLTGLYAKIEGAHAFADHHRYTDQEAEQLLAAAKARGLTPVTTEKDLVRLKGSPALDALAAATLALPVTVTLPGALLDQISARISPARGGAR